MPSNLSIAGVQNPQPVRTLWSSDPDSTTTDQRITVTIVRNDCSSKDTVQEASCEQGLIEPSPNGAVRAQHRRGR
ncbi:hypothetical protein T12_12953 [Trichinella patagoniensis]|uniref:Uncharacterized protein n=1 Tax=Trichinella patagoniensis TaxID=990121 RepID=A0A0V0ZA02_9BILA|nr:hypothetical protein T12_12953 [Trichinella patagoniensis]